MKELKLDVVRFESDDIMTTSCNASLLGVAWGHFYGQAEDFQYYTTKSASSHTVCTGVVAGLTLKEGYSYHVNSNGVIYEECPTYVSYINAHPGDYDGAEEAAESAHGISH